MNTEQTIPFQPTWESLAQYQVPEWYQDAKFGIFIHWGVYSVPAFGSEWYARNMYQEGTPEFEHHVATYGSHENFGYKDFIPSMTFAQFDPDEYARLFVQSGAKFVVPVAEHHDGFAMYNSDLTPWCAAKMGPRRDVLGELARAVRDAGLVFGLSSHRAEHFWFFDGGRKFPSDVQDPAYDSLYGPAAPGAQDWSSPTQAPPTEAFIQEWLARCQELLDKYQPQLVWFDWWIKQKAWEPAVRQFAASYYNLGQAWGTGVAINYKDDSFAPGTAVFDMERGQLADISPQFWQNDTSVSKNSWGYVAHHEYKSANDIIGDLIDVVSKNGALLLNIGPKPDGTIPETEQALLREIGDWLQVNGEAIYGTRPWNKFGEGPTEVGEGSFSDTKRNQFSGEDIRFTRNGEIVYAIALAWPGERLHVRSLTPKELTVDSVEMLGHPLPLDWHQDDEGLHVSLPHQMVGKHAFCFRVQPKS